MEKIRISSVSYANSIPFVWGLMNSGLSAEVELSLDIPSVCADKLKNGAIDIGLVPVAIIPELTYHEVVSNYCLSANNNARTVLLVAHAPKENIHSIYLDPDSRTSNKLVQLLAVRYWNKEYRFIPGTGNLHPGNLEHGHAAVLIGDKAFMAEKQYPYRYDLSEEWRKYTGLPFVFACWVANKPMDDAFLKRFNDALQLGVDNIEQSIENDFAQNLLHFDLKSYLTQNIHFSLDNEKKEAVSLFLKYVRESDAAAIPYNRTINFHKY